MARKSFKKYKIVLDSIRKHETNEVYFSTNSEVFHYALDLFIEKRWSYCCVMNSKEKVLIEYRR